MKGATDDPWLRIIKPPNKTSTIIIGKSQYFFLTLKNSKNSLTNDITKIDFSLNCSFYQPLSNMS